MGVVDKLESFFGGMTVELSAYECPRCGRRLENGETQCPECDEEAREITEYVPVDGDPYA